MPKFDPPNYKKGDVWRAEDAQAIVDELKALGGFRGSGSIQVRRGPRGNQITLSPETMFFIGLTTSTITARVTTTWGTGSVDLYWDDGTGAAVATGDAVTVMHFSSTSIASGKYCAVRKDPFGTWWVISVEC